MVTARFDAAAALTAQSIDFMNKDIKTRSCHALVVVLIYTHPIRGAGNGKSSYNAANICQPTVIE